MSFILFCFVIKMYKLATIVSRRNYLDQMKLNTDFKKVVLFDVRILLVLLNVKQITNK